MAVGKGRDPMTVDLSPYTILLVDDMAYLRQTIEKMLIGLGNPTIHHAEDGAEALDVLHKNPGVNVVISDFNMPAINGLQLLKAVRSGAAGVAPGMPFAMLTGFSDKHLVDMALALDVNTFLIKPVSKKTLTQRLENMLVRGDDDLWVKSPQIYAETFIEEAEDADEIAHDTRDDLIETYKAMRRESEPEPAR